MTSTTELPLPSASLVAVLWGQHEAAAAQYVAGTFKDRVGPVLKSGKVWLLRVQELATLGFKAEEIIEVLRLGLAQHGGVGCLTQCVSRKALVSSLVYRSRRGVLALELAQSIKGKSLGELRKTAIVRASDQGVMVVGAKAPTRAERVAAAAQLQAIMAGKYAAITDAPRVLH